MPSDPHHLRHDAGARSTTIHDFCDLRCTKVDPADRINRDRDMGTDILQKGKSSWRKSLFAVGRINMSCRYIGSPQFFSFECIGKRMHGSTDTAEFVCGIGMLPKHRKRKMDGGTIQSSCDGQKIVDYARNFILSA